MFRISAVIGSIGSLKNLSSLFARPIFPSPAVLINLKMRFRSMRYFHSHGGEEEVFHDVIIVRAKRRSLSKLKDY